MRDKDRQIKSDVVLQSFKRNGSKTHVVETITFYMHIAGLYVNERRIFSSVPRSAKAEKAFLSQINLSYINDLLRLRSCGTIHT